MAAKLFDTKNNLVKHLVVGVSSLAAAFLIRYASGVSWSVSFARVSFLLLFMTLIIGPVMRLVKPSKLFTPLKTPWTWRGELGIWFTVTGLAHFCVVMSGRPGWSLLKALGGFFGGGGYGLANLLGLIALVLAIILSITSFHRIIMFLGIESWKWLQSFAYVIFYLVVLHSLYFQFFSTYGEGPDMFGYSMILMAVVVIALQTAGFIKTLKEPKAVSGKKEEYQV
ncbi:hypothetical protein GF351_06205 [Candidatus Woesearchaeota archaeon]|nr:hypothetical protein [Candidatus Woesearchaeota archaeon]